MKITLIILAVFVLAVLLIFHDDRDPGYDKRERIGPSDGRARKDAGIVPPPLSKAAQAPPVRTEPDRYPDYYNNPPGREEDALERKKLSWSFLYSLEYDEDLDGDTFDTEIAGLQYYVDDRDVGPIAGTVRPEPGNEHDARAQVVVRADGKKLGYIPRRDLDDYEDFNGDGNVCPFAGELFRGEDNWLHADIRVVLPESREFVKEELFDYMGEAQ